MADVKCYITMYGFCSLVTVLVECSLYSAVCRIPPGYQIVPHCWLCLLDISSRDHLITRRTSLLRKSYTSTEFQPVFNQNETGPMFQMWLASSLNKTITPFLDLGDELLIILSYCCVWLIYVWLRNCHVKQNITADKKDTRIWIYNCFI